MFFTFLPYWFNFNYIYFWRIIPRVHYYSDDIIKNLAKVKFEVYFLNLFSRDVLYKQVYFETDPNSMYYKVPIAGPIK